MAEYGEGFAKYVASGNITLSIPPEPERIYVTLGQANLPSSGGPSRMMDEVLSNLSDDATLGGISQTGAFTDPGNLPRNPSGRASPLHGAGSERLGSRTADPFDLDRLMVELNRDGAQNAVDLLAPAGRDSNLFPSNRDMCSATPTTKRTLFKQWKNYCSNTGLLPSCSNTVLISRQTSVWTVIFYYPNTAQALLKNSGFSLLKH